MHQEHGNTDSHLFLKLCLKVCVLLCVRHYNRDHYHYKDMECKAYTICLSKNVRTDGEHVLLLDTTGPGAD